ncbi:hypothetical protein [Methanosarcina sp.]|uniref:hypothetical protein n=1 Tax=Methanosarcina sp. TaxID=2213 RepID=UPI003BB7DBB2
MHYIEERGIIVARQEEIFENIKYEHIQKIIDEHPSFGVHEKDDNILIFRVFKVYEGQNHIDDCDTEYLELLCLCGLEIVHDYDCVCTSSSNLTHHEQLQKIRSEYSEFNIPEMITVPKYLDGYSEKLNYTIVPLLYDHYLGHIKEFVTDRTNESNKVQKQAIVEKNINDSEDFMYYLFKSFFKLARHNGWVDYDELLEDMEKQDYASAFAPGKLDEFFTTYLGDYDSLGLFDERKNANGGLDIQLNSGPDASNIRWVYEIFTLPHRLTEEGTYRQF